MNRRRLFIAGGSIAGAGIISAVFLLAFQETMLVEKGYVNHPDDLGNATTHGVTEAVAREYGYAGDMRQLPLEVAQNIAFNKYWHPMMLDSVAEYSKTLAMKLFDTGYNVGIYRTGRWLQRCLNALNNKGRHYPDIMIDGHIGNETLMGLMKLYNRRGMEGMDVLCECVEGLQVAHYVSISEDRTANESFTYGWIKQRIN